MTDEQIRMAMVLTPAFIDDGDYAHWIRMGRAVLAAAAKLEQAGAEPVAWRVRRHDAPGCWIIFLHKPVDAMKDPEREVQPLYVGAAP